MIRETNPARPTAFDALLKCPAPVFGLDKQGRVVAWNEASAAQLNVSDKARGHGLAEVLGANARELSHLSDDGPVEVRASTRTGNARVVLIPVPLDEQSEPVLAVVLHAWDKEPARDEAPPGAAGVTTREREVLRLLAEGRGTLAIAQELGIARTTARNHIQAILGKLQAHSRLEAVAKARDLSLV